jgi:hypothetical protein
MRTGAAEHIKALPLGRNAPLVLNIRSENLPSAFAGWLAWLGNPQISYDMFGVPTLHTTVVLKVLGQNSYWWILPTRIL